MELIGPVRLGTSCPPSLTTPLPAPGPPMTLRCARVARIPVGWPFFLCIAALLVSVAPASAITIETRPATSSDDAEQGPTSVNLTSSDLELVEDGSSVQTGVFAGELAIPPGATITAAYIQFMPRKRHSVATSLVIRGQAADNA